MHGKKSTVPLVFSYCIVTDCYLYVQLLENLVNAFRFWHLDNRLLYNVFMIIYNRVIYFRQYTFQIYVHYIPTF